MGVLNREPHSTVVIYCQIWTKTGKKTNQKVKDYTVSSDLLMFGEFALTWQYVGVSVLLPVGLQVPCQFGKVCANFIKFLHKPKTPSTHQEIESIIRLKKPKQNILITSNSSIKPLLSLAASRWQCEQNSCRIWALENVCTLRGMIFFFKKWQKQWESTALQTTGRENKHTAHQTPLWNSVSKKNWTK